MKFINCFVDELPVIKCAANCGVSVATAYYMRLRILKIIKENALKWNVGNGQTAQLDETYVLESFKGNRTKSKNFKMPRPAYHRGRNTKGKGPAKTQGRTKGSQLCVLTGIDGEGSVFLEVVGRGMLSKADAKPTLKQRIHKGATITTDDHKAYPGILNELKVVHFVRESNIPQEDLNHVNSLHSALEAFLKKKRGVSSRRLDLYLSEFAWRWMYTKKTESTADVAQKVIRQLAKTAYDEKLMNLNDPFPFFSYWKTDEGKEESERIAISRAIWHANKAMEKARQGLINQIDAENIKEKAKKKMDAVCFAANLDPKRVGSLSDIKVVHASTWVLRSPA